MPELPEVETTVQGLIPVWTGNTIARVQVRRAALRVPLPPRFAARLEGQRIERVTRRAKYIVAHLSGGDAMILHLGMSGRLKTTQALPETFEKHDHVAFEMTDGSAVVFNDPRRFGLIDLVAAGDLETCRYFHHLGAEPLGKDFSPAALAAACRGKKTAIKIALMDQRVVVGVGNIYACEALFDAGINPRRAAGRMTRAEIKTLVAAVRRVLKKAIAAGGSSLRDYRRVDGNLGYFQNQCRVYGRAGNSCPRVSAHRIRRIVQGGRSTFYCPACQK